MKDNSLLKVLIPVSFDSIDCSKEDVVKCIREQNKLYGFTTFMLIFPGKGWRSSIVPPDDDFLMEKARGFREIKEELAKDGIHCGWWNTLTIKNSPVPEWTRIQLADGNNLGFANCPLDSGFSSWFAGLVAKVAKAAKPEFIILEDDYSLHGGCFCKRHLEEFSRREGRNWTREELAKALAEDSSEGREILHRWCRLKRDTLVDFSQKIRHELDLESPEIPIGTCQSGGWNGDGDATEEVTAALAGTMHRPFTRLFGTFYGGEDILSIPEHLFHPLHFKEHLPKNYVCVHETDTFPHTRFFTSAAGVRVMMSAVYSQGYDGSVFQTQQLLDDPNEETVYGRMFAEERRRFQAMHDASKQCHLGGVNIPYIPIDYDKSSWLRCVSHFGIPYTTNDAAVTMLDWGDARFLTDGQLHELFAKGVVIDGNAAKVLYERGYGELMGVDVAEDAVQGLNKYDLEGREVIEECFAKGSKGRFMHLPGFFAPRGNGKSWNLLPHSGCEVITRLITFQKKELGVGMTRFVNKLGGRIVVMGMGTRENLSSALFNYRRQKLMQELIVWCGGDVAFVKDVPKVYVVMNRADSPEDSGFFGMLTLANLNPDSLDGIDLYLPEDWRNVKSVKLLDKNGLWLDMLFTATEDGVHLSLPLDYARPQVLLFS